MICFFLDIVYRCYIDDNCIGKVGIKLKELGSYSVNYYFVLQEKKYLMVINV